MSPRGAPIGSCAILAIIAVASAACLNIPSHLGDDDGSAGSGLRVTRDGPSCMAGATTEPTGCTLTVRTDDLALAFAPDGTRMPSSLTIGNSENLLGGEAVVGSQGSAQDGLGFNLQATSGQQVGINSNLPATSVGPTTLTVLASGPAYLEVEVMGNVASTCAGAIAWTTLFSVFPDGRIVRDDQLALPTSSGCSAISSYTTVRLDSMPISQLQYQVDSSGGNIITSANTVDLPVGSGSYRMCYGGGPATSPGPHVDVVYLPGDTTDFQEVRLSNEVPMAVGVLNDWIYTGSGASGQPLAGMLGSGDTVYQIDGRSSCNAFDQRLATMPAMADTTTVADPRTGLYKTPFMPDADNSMTVTAPAGGLPAGIAIEIDQGPAAMKVSSGLRQLVVGVDYLIQTDVELGDMKHRDIIWFTSPIDPTEIVQFRGTM